MIEELQKELEELKQEEKALKNKRLSFIQKAKSNGFALIDEKLVANDESWAIVWDLTYYDSYVGEKGALYDYLEGATSISDEEYERLKTALQEKDEEEMMEVLCEHVGDEYYFYTILKDGKLTFSDNGSFKWKQDKEGDNFGDLCKNSFFEVKRMTKDAIDAVPSVYETNSF